MAKAVVTEFIIPSEQPTDGTVQIVADCILGGVEVLGGAHHFGVAVIVDPVADSVNEIVNNVAAAVRAYAAVQTPLAGGGSGVTIPANGIDKCGLTKA